MKNGDFVAIASGGRSSPRRAIENLTMGLCIDEELQPFRLRISGNGGCNRFMAGKPARASGSSAAPPVAEAVR